MKEVNDFRPYAVPPILPSPTITRWEIKEMEQDVKHGIMVGGAKLLAALQLARDSFECVEGGGEL